VSSSAALTTNWVLYGVQYAAYILELCIAVSLVRGGRWRRLKGLALYVAILFLLDGVARPAVYHFFGRSSAQYFYFYFTTDVVFALTTSLVICGFYWRACLKKEKLWGHARLLLILVFFLVLAAAAARSFIRGLDNPRLSVLMMIEFSQSLYIACLVLNTLIYVMLKVFAIDDGELGLLVFGLGLQLASGAVGFALLHSTFYHDMARAFMVFMAPAGTLGMLLVWLYALAWRSGNVELTG